MSFLLVAFGFIRNSWIGRALAMAAGISAAVWLIFFAGKRSQRKEQEIENLNEYIDVRKRADEAADAARKVGGTLSDAELVARLRKHRFAIRD